MKRREFITVLGSAAVFWPLSARSQAALPLIGYLSQGTSEGTAAFVEACRNGLAESGIVEGKDVTSELQSAHNDVDRLPRLAADLVQHRPAVIITLDTDSAARAAKAATTAIPIVFVSGTDPVQTGLVTSFNHPGDNVTGISSMNLDLGSKWVGLLRELVPVPSVLRSSSTLRIADQQGR